MHDALTSAWYNKIMMLIRAVAQESLHAEIPPLPHIAAFIILMVRPRITVFLADSYL